MASISSINSTSFGGVMVFVRGVKYPIIPTLTPFTVRTVDLCKFEAAASSGLFDKSKLAVTIGYDACSMYGNSPDMFLSNSWLPKHFGK